MVNLSAKWAEVLLAEPETGMGYQIVSVELKDGTKFDQVAVIGGAITQIRGHNEIPFIEDQISKILVTHDKWDFGKER